MKGRCPNCNYALNIHVGMAGGNSPRIGDICICADCQSVLEYLGNEEFKAPSAEELDELIQDSDLKEELEQARIVARLFKSAKEDGF